MMRNLDYINEILNEMLLFDNRLEKLNMEYRSEFCQKRKLILKSILKNYTQ